MSNQIVPQWAVLQFNQNVQMLTQQTDTRLSAAVTHGSYVGSAASPVDFVEAVEMVDVVGRFEPMPRIDANLTRRWVSPLDAHLPQQIDSFDKLRLLADPKSTYVQNAVASANRNKDKRIGNAFFAAAATGVQGASSTSFDTTNQVVGVNTGGTDSALNVAKLEKTRSIFLANNVDLSKERIHIALTSKDDLALRSEIQVISMEFNSSAVFDENGLLMGWRGFVFHHLEIAALTTEATDDQSGSSRAVPAWVPSGMHLGIWNDINTNVSQRNDLTGEPWQAYTKLSCNATRLEEKKVVKIWCGS